MENMLRTNKKQRQINHWVNEKGMRIGRTDQKGAENIIQCACKSRLPTFFHFKTIQTETDACQI